MKVYLNFSIVNSKLNHYFQKKNPTPKKVFIRKLFLGDLSVQIHDEPKSFLFKHPDDKASVYIVNALSKIEENFCFKDKQPLLMKSRIVYKLTVHAHVNLHISVRLGVTYLI